MESETPLDRARQRLKERPWEMPAHMLRHAVLHSLSEEESPHGEERTIRFQQEILRFNDLTKRVESWAELGTIILSICLFCEMEGVSTQDIELLRWLRDNHWNSPDGLTEAHWESWVADVRA